MLTSILLITTILSFNQYLASEEYSQSNGDKNGNSGTDIYIVCGVLEFVCSIVSHLIILTLR